MTKAALTFENVFMSFPQTAAAEPKTRELKAYENKTRQILKRTENDGSQHH